MVTPKKKDEVLAETTKTYLRDIYIKETYGRERPDITSGAMLKGTIVESDSLELIAHVTKQIYFKNLKHYENDFIKGTPDVVTKGNCVKDVKSSFSIFTFSSVDSKKAKDDYFWQIFGYGWLTGKPCGQLMYALVNTPEEIIEKDMYRAAFSNIGLLNADPLEVEKFRKNYIFDDIPEEVRLKTFDFEFDPALIDSLKERITAARVFLQGLTL
jgi:hypothetical protein